MKYSLRNLTNEIKIISFSSLLLLSIQNSYSLTTFERFKKLQCIKPMNIIDTFKFDNEKIQRECVNPMAITDSAIKILNEKNKNHIPIRYPRHRRILCKLSMLNSEYCKKLESDIRNQIIEAAKYQEIKLIINTTNESGLYAVNNFCSNIKHQFGNFGKSLSKLSGDIMYGKRNKNFNNFDIFKPKKKCILNHENIDNKVTSSDKNNYVIKVKTDFLEKKSKSSLFSRIPRPFKKNKEIPKQEVKTYNNNIPPWSDFYQNKTKSYVEDYEGKVIKPTKTGVNNKQYPIWSQYYQDQGYTYTEDYGTDE